MTQDDQRKQRKDNIEKAIRDMMQVIEERPDGLARSLYLAITVHALDALCQAHLKSYKDAE